MSEERLKRHPDGTVTPACGVTKWFKMIGDSEHAIQAAAVNLGIKLTLPMIRGWKHHNAIPAHIFEPLDVLVRELYTTIRGEREIAFYKNEVCLFVVKLEPGVWAKVRSKT